MFVCKYLCVFICVLYVCTRDDFVIEARFVSTGGCTENGGSYLNNKRGDLLTPFVVQ